MFYAAERSQALPNWTTPSMTISSGTTPTPSRSFGAIAEGTFDK